MNRLMESVWLWIEASHGLRDEIIAGLSDADLAFNPGGDNITFGALIRECGEIEHSYAESLRTLKQDFDYRNPGLASSVQQLQAWFQQLDADMKATLAAFSDADVESKQVTRASGYQMPIEMQLQTYLQALMIFFGKAVTYLRAMGKPLSKNIQEWVG